MALWITVDKTEDDFLDPLDAPKTSDNDFDGLTWENSMLKSEDERFIRTVLGEHVCPRLYNALVTTLPIPANDNEPKEGVKPTE